MLWKVMIVDDEKSICDGMQQLIEWDACGFTVCCTARSGEEALKLYSRHQPDLILTDIKMPWMSGLDLIRTLRENNSTDPEFIIMSGYAEFEYARQALKYGVSNYVLKPVDENEVHGLLIETGKRLSLRRNYHDQDTRSLLSSFASGSSINYEIDEPEWMLNEAEFGVRAVRIDAWRYILNPASSFGNMLDPLAVARIAPIEAVFRKFVEEILHFNHSFVTRDEGVCLEVIAGSTVLRPWHNDVRSFARIARDWFRTNNVRVDILIGDRVDSLRELRLSAASLERRGDAAFFGDDSTHAGLGDGIFDRDRLVPEGYLEHPHTDWAEKVTSAVKASRTNEVQTIVLEIEDAIRKGSLPPRMARAWYKNICLRIISLKNNSNEYSERAAVMFGVWEQRLEKMGLTQLTRLLIELSESVIEHLEYKCKDSKADVMSRVIRYMQTHYDECLDLKLLAGKFYLHPAYLGQLFRKKTGSTPKQYLNSLRMEEAKNLLDNTDMKVYEIAHKVGFEDSNYFIVRFESYVGLSPSAYRLRKNISEPNS